nr:hypothetical protein [Tanacetum cinerariifolium]
MSKNHSKDRLVKAVLMMVLVMHTEEDDTELYIEKTGMLMLVVEIDVGGMTADVVDKLNCSSDDVQPNLRSAHALTELHCQEEECSRTSCLPKIVPTSYCRYSYRSGAMKISMQTSGSGIFNLLAVTTTFTGSGNLYCQCSGTPSRRLEKLMVTTSSWIRKSAELTLKCSELGYSSNCDMLSTIRTDQMHQPWRMFAAVINKCIFGKPTRLGRLRESQAQIPWAMYNQMNVDYVSLLMEDFMYQADNREISSARKKHMPYPRFTKVIINHFISKDNTILARNRINLHTTRDDTLLGALKFISKTEDYQKYGALIPDGMINQDIKDSKACKTYLDYATRKVPPKKARKFKKHASPKHKTVPASLKEPTQKGKRVKRAAKKATTAPTTGVIIRDTPGKLVSNKKAPAKTDRGKGIELMSDVALLKEAQLKETLRKSKQETYKLQASGSSKGADFESEVPDEHAGKTKDISEGTGVKPRVLDVSKEDSSNSDDDSWGDSEDESDDVHDEDNNDDDDGNDDDSGNDDDGGNDAQDSKQTNSDDDENPSFTLKDYEEKEQYEEDLNISEGLRDIDMTNAEQGAEDQQNSSHESGFMQKEEDDHVTLTTVHDKTKGPLQSSFISSNITTKLLNIDDSSSDINSLMNTSTVPPLPPPANLFDQSVSTLETKVSEFNQTSQFAEAISSISSIVNNYLASKLKEEVNVVVQLQSNKLKEEAKVENQEFINQTSYAVAASLLKFKLKKFLIEKMETNESINISDIQRNLYNALVESYNTNKHILSIYRDVVILERGRDDQDKDEDPFAGSN